MRNSLNAIEINIGKNGVNDNVIEEIKRQLKNQEIIKIRFTRSISFNKDEFLEEITKATKAKLIDVRGNVAVLYKRK
ncbi:MAG: YhbY family RNA-binding protein [Methanosphaera sp.]|uniref:YhbY family RNA-binding protein n=1 Tax=Methanosphaera sp. TaxID=2666342 RepID=UPI0025E8DF90|nr:YhbY family RNA-binding protein [Methanosphaera sp.]MCI5867871.1 YhbY family RNA-binding protein [Methanosphaera sp.]MDD6534881.1 YhbY family RNA-binding protein [Methanosphaera sp.]MDY3955341.1 YhbY family RNA-binding protein [Methanosphaera sp.]